MATYTSARDGGIVQGQPVQLDFNGQGGIRKEWWWEAGPVDSCCCCCSLRAGVAVLAVIDLVINGIWALFFLEGEIDSVLEDELAQMQEAYDDYCHGAAAVSPACEQVADSIEQLHDSINLMHHLPATYYLNCILCMIAGAVGLWAVFGRSALAAKLYMYSWPAKFVLGIFAMIFGRAAMKKYGVKVQVHHGLGTLLNIVFLIYYLKVCWSYHERLKTQSNGDTTAYTGVDVGIEAGTNDALEEESNALRSFK